MHACRLRYRYNFYVAHHILISLFLWLLEGHFCSLVSIKSIKMCTGWRGSMLKYTNIVNQIILFQRSKESNVFHDMSPLNISSSMLWSTKHNLKGRTFTRRPKEIFLQWASPIISLPQTLSFIALDRLNSQHMVLLECVQSKLTQSDSFNRWLIKATSHPTLES